jgi:hypothetical protein
LIGKINLSVIDGILLIEDKNKFGFVRSFDNMTEVRLNFATLLAIISHSDGTITSSDTIKTSLHIEASGASGDISLNINASSIYIYTDKRNTASITLNGKVNDIQIYNRGFNQIHLSNLCANNAQVEHYGTGNINLKTKNLTEKIYGAGKIFNVYQ